VNAVDLELLCCPTCRAALAVDGESLRCTSGHSFPVVRGIPRFVPQENYASGFGLQWTRHARTQYDSESGTNLSAHRFFDEAGFPRDLTGQVIVEAGSGSGRFTEQALSTGATVLSFDYSAAVEANYASNGAHPNLLLAQADIYRMPFRDGVADRCFCFGVLQHTPDPKAAFLALPSVLKPGGVLVADLYLKSPVKHLLGTKYWVRPFTRGRHPERLYRLVTRYIDLVWPLAALVRRLPRGASLNWRLLVADYSSVGVPDRVLKEWAYLNTFDMLAPRYDYPQKIETVKGWVREADLEDASVELGMNGIAIKGRRRRLT
jgi:SAM-dependent methyltransferase